MLFWLSHPVKSDFYPRPPRGGRRAYGLIYNEWFRFLSTPSARRATRARPATATSLSIFLSTPSARRATQRHIRQRQHLSNFYPRPPRGGRPRVGRQNGHNKTISIHALREEGDGLLVIRGGLVALFLSTPSARRATAKTETKSLFSYKLYNILHEFRRALIYNGSKNDPNHAK